MKTGVSPPSIWPEQIAQALHLGILSEADAALLRDYDAKVLNIINVDDFAPHELGVDAGPEHEAQLLRPGAKMDPRMQHMEIYESSHSGIGRVCTGGAALAQERLPPRPAAEVYFISPQNGESCTGRSPCDSGSRAWVWPRQESKSTTRVIIIC